MQSISPGVARRPRAQRRALALCFGAALALSFFVAVLRQCRAEESASMSTAPDFTAQGIDGKTYRLQDLLKKGPVLLDFWTTYCGPCMMELPKLQKLADKYKDQGFTLVGVVCDDQKTAAKIKPTIQSKGFKFLNLSDADHKIGSLYSVRQFPVSVLIAADGKIVSKTEGYKPGAERDFEKKIIALLPPSGTNTPSGK